MLSSALRFLFLASTIFVLASCAKPKSQKDCGYVQNVYGERVSWKQQVPVKMYVHTSVPAEYDSAIKAAADTWNHAHGRDIIIVDTINRVSGAGPARDGKNVIYLMSTWEADRTSEQARTSLYWVGDQIQEADIRINAQNYQFYISQNGMTGVNIQALVLHEMGHVLGLKHNDASPSVMATYLKSNQDRTQLQYADVSSLQCEY